MRAHSTKGRRAVLLATAAVFASAGPRAHAVTRLLGVDVSDYQSQNPEGQDINWTLAHTPKSQGGGGIDFTFIRATRGGQYGSYVDAGATGGDGSYADYKFIYNITHATSAGVYSGPYHFLRADITNYTWQGVSRVNSGTNEAIHFLDYAGTNPKAGDPASPIRGDFMRPGYLLPVLDLEAGGSQRSADDLAAYAVEFGQTIYNAKGIWPIVYSSSSYASEPADASNNFTGSGNNSGEIRPIVAQKIPNLWLARWPNQANPNSIDIQNIDPPAASGYPNAYGVWNPTYPDTPQPAPWKFWQYASTGTGIPGILGDKNHHVDLDVAHGGFEFIKDYLVPALWMSDTGGNWADLSATTWNSYNADPTALAGPSRLPNANDTAILDRPNANITITFQPGTAATVRKLFVKEQLNLTGGVLNVGYVPSSDSTPYSAIFSNTVTLSGTAQFSVHTLNVDPGTALNLNGGTLTLNTLNLARDPATPAKIAVGGNVIFAPLSNAAAAITGVFGTGLSPTVDLGGGTRTLSVSDGTAAVDLAVNVPIVNGTLTKSGLGTMALGATNSLSGVTTINDGILLVTDDNQLGSSVVTNMTVVTPGSAGSGHGGSLQLSGGVNYNLPLTINGGGVNGVNATAPGNVGALDNLSGDNTWAGAITLSGAGTTGSDPTENQIGARAGTLFLSGAIQGPGIALPNVLAKTGDGDVVLTGTAANAYGGFTRLFGGRLIVEKNFALGAIGSANSSPGNTFQLAGSASTLAFRAPAGSAGLNYSAFEVINTSGTGAPGFAQVDSLGGDNTFAGRIAFGGPTVLGVITGSIGVTAGSLEVQGGLYARGSDAGVRDITKTGAGTLILSGGGSGAATGDAQVVPLSGSTFNVNAGTIDLRGATAATNLLPGVTTWNVNAGAALKNTAGTLAGTTVNVATGGRFTYAGGSTNLVALNLAGGAAAMTPGGAKVLRTSSLSVTGGGTLDLADNDLIIRYAGAASPAGSWNGSAYTGVTGLVATGRNDGNWNGPGIRTTAAATPGGDYTTLGVAEASDALGLSGTQTATWNGHSVDATSLVVMYTYGGDANLDGVINIDDYTEIDASMSVGGSLKGWFNGDFNYDGSVDIDDYTIIDSNIAIQGTSLATAAPLGGFASPAGVAAVPEPASVALTSIMFLTVASRRRRRHRL